jgi:putative MATE family efflux protein
LPIWWLFVANALPMMVMMLMSGMLAVVDAAFLGHFVGPDALAAVSLVFPILMVTIALSTLVSGGMSSLLARQLGAEQRNDAMAVFAQAHGLALFLSMLMIAAFSTIAGFVIGQLSGGEADIAHMAYTYLAIMIFASPLQLLLGVHADAWRNEGHAGLIALMSAGVTLANIALNYVLIVPLDMGVAGSALGTAIAQGAGLALLVGLRWRGGGILRISGLWKSRWIGGWRPILALGAPVSLSFIGIALVSATVITTLRLTAGAGYVESVAAYGIVTRILSFTFLPLLAIAMASQTIVGHNVGAKLYQRSLPSKASTASTSRRSRP